MRLLQSLIAAVALACSATVAIAVAESGEFGARAPEFPPGNFSDNRRYSLQDLKGKVVVLYFYESSCPGCRANVPQVNKMAASFKDKPIKFIAVAPHDTLPETKSYVGLTRLTMPTFADPFGVMQKRYGFTISLQNIIQFRIVGPDGIVSGYRVNDEWITKTLAKTRWTYKDAGYHPTLSTAVDAFEWNQWSQGMRLLKLHLSANDTAVKESAEKLAAEIKKLGEQWKEEAEKLTESSPVEAFDLYQRIVNTFETDALATEAAEAQKKLRQNKVVIAELDARKAYLQLENALGRATAAQRTDIANLCRNLIKKYPDTPTAKKVQTYLNDLGG